MKQLSMGKVNETCLHLDGVYALSQTWGKRGYSFMKSLRPEHGLCLFLQGRAEYQLINPETVEEEFLTAHEVDLIYLPKNSRYTVHFYPDHQPVKNYLLNFMLYNRDLQEIFFAPKVKRLLKNTPASVIEVFSAAAAVFEQKAQNTNKMKALAYQALSDVSALSVAASAQKRGYSLIAPGVAYMENHISEAFTVADLARLCNVSETYFRRLFKRYAGKSPLQHKNDILLGKARQLLASRELSVQEISDRLGYFDTAYFCKVFKKNTGLTPREYMNKT